MKGLLATMKGKRLGTASARYTYKSRGLVTELHDSEDALFATGAELPTDYCPYEPGIPMTNGIKWYGASSAASGLARVVRDASADNAVQAFFCTIDSTVSIPLNEIATAQVGGRRSFPGGRSMRRCASRDGRGRSPAGINAHRSSARVDSNMPCTNLNTSLEPRQRSSPGFEARAGFLSFLPSVVTFERGARRTGRGHTPRMRNPVSQGRSMAWSICVYIGSNLRRSVSAPRRLMA